MAGKRSGVRVTGANNRVVTNTFSNQPVGTDPLANPMVEFGATGLRQFSGYVREEWLPELIGWRGMRIYQEMRDNDPLVGAIFYASQNLLQGVDFHVDPATAAPEDAAAADFVNSCFTDLEQSWPELMSQFLTMMQFGWQVSEIVYKMRRGESSDPRFNSRYDDGLFGWRKFAGRAQQTLLHWVFDESGDAVGLVQLLPTGGPLLNVPLAKCLHFRTVLNKANPEGRSLLRNTYKPWYFKTKIEELEAIGIERELAGLPIAWVPPRLLQRDASPADRAQLEEFKKMVRDTVRNEQAGFVLPLVYDKDGHKLYDFTLLSTAGRRQIDTSTTIERYDQRILATFLADFITLGTGGSSGRGSFAQSKNKTDMFSDAITALLDIITNEFNRKGIPDLLNLNKMQGSCILKHGEISGSDIAALGTFLQQTVSVGVITPDPNLEAKVREEAGLPTQPGTPGNTLIDGGEAQAAGDTTGAVSASNAPDNAQGEGINAPAAGGLYKRRTRKLS